MAKHTQQAPKPSYFVGILAWLVPGLGHYRLGHRARGAIIFTAIMSLFIMGLALGSVYVVQPEIHRAWFVAQVLAGLPALITAWISSHWTAVAGSAAQGVVPVIQDRGFDIGQIYVGVAGLLNLLCILDAIFRSQMPESSPSQPSSAKVSS